MHPANVLLSLGFCGPIFKSAPLLLRFFDFLHFQTSVYWSLLVSFLFVRGVLVVLKPRPWIRLFCLFLVCWGGFLLSFNQNRGSASFGLLGGFDGPLTKTVVGPPFFFLLGGFGGPKTKTVYRPLLISCLLRRVLMVVKLKPWFSLFCFFGLLGSPITEAGEFWWSYNQSRVPCRIFKILSFRSRTCAVNLTVLSSFLPFPFPFEFSGNNRNQDCSPGCLASLCCLHALCIVVVDFWVFLAARLPENVLGKSPQLSSAQ